MADNFNGTASAGLEFQSNLNAIRHRHTNERPVTAAAVGVGVAGETTSSTNAAAAINKTANANLASGEVILEISCHGCSEPSIEA